MNKQQQRNFDKHQHVFRGTHVRLIPLKLTRSIPHIHD